MANYLVLLRAVNVGGKNRMPMAELREALSKVGYENLATYIQSGNVVLSSSESSDVVGDRVQQCIKEVFGHDVSVLIRSEAELETIVNNFPYPSGELNQTGVVFLDRKPAGDLNCDKFAPDECAAAGSNIYVHCPTGFGTTKLSAAWVERQTGCSGTRRNWKTVLKLQAMLQS